MKSSRVRSIVQMVRHGSIASRLRISLITGTVLILLLVAGSSYIASRQILEEQNQDRLEHLAEGTAKAIEAEFSSVKNLAEGMALQLEFRPPGSAEELREMQELCLRGNEHINGTCIAFDRQALTSGSAFGVAAPFVHRDGGDFVYSDLGLEQEPYDQEEWFARAKSLRRTVWTEPYADPASSGTVMVTYSVPFYKAEGRHREFQGVVTADVTLERLKNLHQSLPLSGDDYAFIISSKGTYIAHPREDLVMKETFFSAVEKFGNPAMKELGNRMIRGERDIVDFQSLRSGQTSWLAFSPIPATGWSLGVVLSKIEMNRELRSLSGIQILLGVLGTLLLLLVIQVVARSITKPIMDLRQKAKVLATGDLDTPIIAAPSDRDEVASLATAFETMRADLKRYMAQLSETVGRKERIESELRIAHGIQMGLVPKTFPASPQRRDLDLHALMVPASDVGGDFYDFSLLDDRRLLLAIADVSGKGVPAALFMAVTRSFLRSFVRGVTSLPEAMAHINDELSTDNDACMFVTLFCAIVDLETGAVEYLNAGHNFPFRIRRDGGLLEISDQHGPPLGIVEGAEYTSSELRIEPNDLLYIYTDGVNEAMNPAKELFGDERLRNQLARSADAPCDRVVSEMLDAIREHAQGAEQSDDITMIAMRWLGPAA